MVLFYLAHLLQIFYDDYFGLISKRQNKEKKVGLLDIRIVRIYISYRYNIENGTK